MDSLQMFLILRARYKLILFALVATVISAVAFAWTMAPRYKATTKLVIDFKVIDTVTGFVLPIQALLASYMATEVDILESQPVALKVVEALHLAENEKTKARFLDATEGKGTIEDWLATGLRGKLEVKPSKESRIIDINFTNTDPEFAAKVANAYAQAYVRTNLEMKVAPARESAVWFDDQLKQLRTRVEDAQGRLTKYQTDKGITSTDQRLDVETSKLGEISTQLVQAEAQSYEFSSRQKQLQEFMSKDRPVDSLPEVLSSPVIQELKARLSIAETKLSQASNNLGANHPDYQRAQSEVTGLRKKLRDEVNTAAAVIGNNLRVVQGREQELRDSASAQKARLLELNRHRDELGVLTKEVENAQKAYDAASTRHNQTSLESRMDQSNVTVLAPAVAPILPNFPKLPLILGVAVIIGTLLGIGFALAVEMVDRRIRGAEDLMAAIGTQVWGVLQDTSPLSKEVSRKQRKMLKRSRFLKPLNEPTL
ncbi:MAG: chain length determinant protein EpsF [Betaproteobacteria bacterium]